MTEPVDHSTDANPIGSPQALKRRSGRGGVFSIVMQGFQFIVRTSAMIVLARLLSPSIFGVFFMVTVATELTSSFRDQGIPHAIARSDGLSESVRSALFASHARFNLLVSAGIVATSPLLALFFDERQIVPVAVVLAAGLALDGAANVHLGMLRQRLDFSREAMIDAGALVVSSALAIVAAALGWGLWALALQHVTQRLVHAIAVLSAIRWRPTMRARNADQETLAAVRAFGHPLALSRLLLHLARNVDRIVVGRIAGSESLGLYQAAYGWSVIPAQMVATPLLFVVSTSLARVRVNVEQYRTWFSASFLGVCALCLPVLAGAAATAPTLVDVLLGPEWADAALLLRILTPAAAASLVSAALKWAYYAEGHTDRLLSWSYRILPVTVVAVSIGAQWGTTGVAVAWSGVTIASKLPETWWCVSRSILRSRDVWIPFGRCTVAAGAGAAASVAILGSEPPGVAGVVIGFVIVGFVFTTSLLALPNGLASIRQLSRFVNTLRG